MKHQHTIARSLALASMTLLSQPTSANEECMSLSQQLWKSLPCRLICNAKGSECMKEAKTNSDKIVACSRETLDCERKNCTAKAPVNVPEWCDINTGQVKPGHQAPVR